MTLPALSFVIFNFGLYYLILALQLGYGFPPFYAKGKFEAELKRDLPALAALMLLVALSALVPHVFAVSGLVAIWAGIRVRLRVKNRTNGPRPWLLTPLTTRVATRLPMLLFDVWTCGFAALMTGLVIGPATAAS